MWKEVTKNWYIKNVHNKDVITPWASIKFYGRWAVSEQKLRFGAVVGKTVSDMHSKHKTRYYRIGV